MDRFTLRLVAPDGQKYKPNAFKDLKGHMAGVYMNGNVEMPCILRDVYVRHGRDSVYFVFEPEVPILIDPLEDPSQR